MKLRIVPVSLLLLALFFTASQLNAQRKSKKTSEPEIPAELYSSMDYRLVGPFRGGRSAAVTGVPGKPNLFYFGAPKGFIE